MYLVLAAELGDNVYVALIFAGMKDTGMKESQKLAPRFKVLEAPEATNF